MSATIRAISYMGLSATLIMGLSTGGYLLKTTQQLQISVDETALKTATAAALGNPQACEQAQDYLEIDGYKLKKCFTGKGRNEISGIWIEAEKELDLLGTKINLKARAHAECAPPRWKEEIENHKQADSERKKHKR
ncbi:hypothetical protein KRX54_01130 [Actinomycetaceae bacterium TAE3-ERU4]|nr:hypothetical protein [Actinomycetaceae bacterium TAE3-ERU4]